MSQTVTDNGSGQGRLFDYAGTRLLSSLPGFSLPTIMTLLRNHHRKIDKAYLPRVAFLLATGTLVSTFAGLDRWFGGGVGQPAVEPVFILGHWRSGTTFLHQMLACDPRFATPSHYRTTLPHCFRSTERWLKPAIQHLLPPTRVYDDVALDLDAAWEDETALCTMTLMSPVMASIFPRDSAAFEHYLSMEGVPEQERERWATALRTFLTSALSTSGTIPLLKSPPHTARIGLLRQIFPDARFIHVHRHPFEVYQSTVHMMRVFGAQVQLQSPEPNNIADFVVKYYRLMHEAYFAQRDELSSHQLVEVSYNDLVAAPLNCLSQVYAQLSLGDFDTIKPRIQQHLAGLQGYRRGKRPKLDAAVNERLSYEWSESFRNWGYVA